MTADPAAYDGEVPAAVHAVRSAQERLADVDSQPVAAHIETYDGVHATLQDALAELDET